MKIRLAILEKDMRYLNSIVSAFSTKFADKLVVYSFTDPEIAMASLESAKIEVLLASDSFDIRVEQLPKRCGFAYFVDTVGVEYLNGQHAICKFQKADLIYKQILNIHSEKANDISGGRAANGNCRSIAFTSPCGGAGSSTMAAACALHFALQGKKTLYLNLEMFASTDAFFTGDGQLTMSDIIFALKSKKANIMMKVESCVRQTAEGLYFFAQPRVSADMLELGLEDMQQLVSELSASGAFDYMILDMGFRMDADTCRFLKQTDRIVWTGNGTAIANRKLKAAHQALSMLEEREDAPLTKQTVLVYNRFGSTGRSLEGVEIEEIGGTPNYTGAEPADIVRKIAAMGMFDKLA